jgi:hypothetical protein
MLLPPKEIRGLQDFPETPMFLSDATLGPIHWDFEHHAGYWFISDIMKSVLQEVDPEAFSFVECDVRSSDGRQRPKRWLCRIDRVLDALDEERSGAKLCVNSAGDKVYRIFCRRKLIFNASKVENYHVFKMKYCDPLAICDEEVRQACKSAELTGISFSATD